MQLQKRPLKLCTITPVILEGDIINNNLVWFLEHCSQDKAANYFDLFCFLHLFNFFKLQIIHCFRFSCEHHGSIVFICLVYMFMFIFKHVINKNNGCCSLNFNQAYLIASTEITESTTHTHTILYYVKQSYLRLRTV